MFWHSASSLHIEISSTNMFGVENWKTLLGGSAPNCPTWALVQNPTLSLGIHTWHEASGVPILRSRLRHQDFVGSAGGSTLSTANSLGLGNTMEHPATALPRYWHGFLWSFVGTSGSQCHRVNSNSSGG